MTTTRGCMWAPIWTVTRAMGQVTSVGHPACILIRAREMGCTCCGRSPLIIWMVETRFFTHTRDEHGRLMNNQNEVRFGALLFHNYALILGHSVIRASSGRRRVRGRSAQHPRHGSRQEPPRLIEVFIEAGHATRDASPGSWISVHVRRPRAMRTSTDQHLPTGCLGHRVWRWKLARFTESCWSRSALTENDVT
jgi:hypothetical protein